jgi:branched-chain amino acid transport system substrate-binding protein
MLQDGAESVAIVYQDTSYGVGLKGVAEKSVKAGGGSVTSYAFPENETNFSSIVDKVVASGPDAVLLISYDESKKALPALKAKGYNGGNIYLVDGNLVDYSGESYGSYLNGAKGTNPGKALTDAFKKRLSAAYAKAEGGKELKEFVYGAETYDAVMLAAIAAQAAKDASGPGIRKELTNISKAGKGKVKVTSFKAALAALKANKKVDYDGVSGPIEFDANGDPTGAFIGIYRYGASGTYKLVKVVAGNTVK